jgi:hypothetical protein
MLLIIDTVDKSCLMTTKLFLNGKSDNFFVCSTISEIGNGDQVTSVDPLILLQNQSNSMLNLLLQVANVEMPNLLNTGNHCPKFSGCF